MVWLLLLLGLLLPWPVAAAYEFHTIDVAFPGASDTVVTGLNDRGLAIGLYRDAEGHDQGFAQTRGGRTTMLLNVVPQALTTDEVLVGWFLAPTGGTQGFLLHEGTFTLIPGPFVRGKGFPRLVEPTAVNAVGLVVGTFRSQADDQLHGFLYDRPTRTFLQVDVPGAQQTLLRGINNLGQQVGVYVDSDGQRVLFRREGMTVDVVTVPGLTDVDLVGITDDGRLVGNTPDEGFVLAGGVVDRIAVPQAQRTQLFGLRQDGAVYGRFVDADGVAHGLIALPEGGDRTRLPGPRPLLRGFEVLVCPPGSTRPACQQP